MSTIDLGALVAGIARQWDGVAVQPSRIGSIALCVGHREIGHLHAGGVADLLVPVRLRRDLVAAGRAEPHRTQPNYERLRGVPRPRVVIPIITKPTLLADRSADDLPA